VLSQAGFLLTGVSVLAMLAGGSRSIEWQGTMALAVIAACGFLLAQRLGLLRHHHVPEITTQKRSVV
jgi:hypothetical protein